MSEYTDAEVVQKAYDGASGINCLLLQESYDNIRIVGEWIYGIG